MRAKIAAGAIAAKGLELATARGIDSVHLGIGIAEWRHDDSEYRAPVLLRPLAIRRHGRDFEVKLRGAAFLNPAFARALDAQFQVTLDADAFVALADDDGTFKPNAVIDRPAWPHRAPAVVPGEPAPRRELVRRGRERDGRGCA